MESHWAAEHLQVIRTLMERSAIYRRALAPTMCLTGTLGLVAAVAGCLAKIHSLRAFALYWFLIGLAGVWGAFMLVRRQALKEAEPFWSPPTRRVTQALLPSMTAGLILTVVEIVTADGLGRGTEIVRLPALWIILYGCALHAAGFFTPRGMKLFGWGFVLGGCAVLILGIPDWPERLWIYGHSIMGFFFGLLHLAYGVYLYFTEQGKNVA